MSRPMSTPELSQVLKRIALDFNPFKSRIGKSGQSVQAVKYVHPNFDNRTNTWFSITIRTMGGAENTFHCANECRDLPESLFERVNAFLDVLEA